MPDGKREGEGLRLDAPFSGPSPCGLFVAL